VFLAHRRLFKNRGALELSSAISKCSSRISGFIFISQLTGFGSLLPLVSLSSVVGPVYFYASLLVVLILMTIFTIFFSLRVSIFYKRAYSTLIEERSTKRSLSVVKETYSSLKKVFLLTVVTLLGVVFLPILSSAIAISMEKFAVPFLEFTLVGLVLGGFTGTIMSTLPSVVEAKVKSIESLGAKVAYSYGFTSSSYLGYSSISSGITLSKIEDPLLKLIRDLSEVGEVSLVCLDVFTGDLVLVSNKWIFAEKVLEDWCMKNNAWALEKKITIEDFLKGVREERKYYTLVKLKETAKKLSEKVLRGEVRVRVFELGSLSLRRVSIRDVYGYILKAYSTIIVLLVMTVVISILS